MPSTAASLRAQRRRWLRDVGVSAMTYSASSRMLVRTFGNPRSIKAHMRFVPFLESARWKAVHRRSATPGTVNGGGESFIRLKVTLWASTVFVHAAGDGSVALPCRLA